MTEPNIAKMFIERVSQITDYSISIINGEGLVIASSEESKIGRYDEKAIELITGDRYIMEIQGNGEEGGEESRCIVVIGTDHRVGAIEIMGDPAQNRNAALLLKTMSETMFGYERLAEELRRRDLRRDSFFGFLTHDEEKDPVKLHEMAELLAYDESLVRVPILCSLRKKEMKEKINAQKVLLLMRQGPGYGFQDLTYVVDNLHVLIFKTVQVDMSSMKGCEEQIMLYLQPVCDMMDRSGFNYNFYVGTFQRDFRRYIYAFRHCKWLENNLELPEKVEFFDRHAIDYFRWLWPKDELNSVFDVLEPEIRRKFKKQYMELIKALMRTNYNLAEAAKVLKVHRNTLVYRYNKIKELTGLDPLANAADRGILEMLYYYLI